MNFLIDAHLPRKVAKLFGGLGHKAIHTKDLPKGNASSDQEILGQIGPDWIVISKDDDFYHSFLVKREPSKLILVKVGNMRLKEVILFFEKNATTIVDLLGQHDLIELHRDKIIVIA